MAKQIKTGQDREQRKNNFSIFFDISNQDAILPLLNNNNDPDSNFYNNQNINYSNFQPNQITIEIIILF